MQLFADDVALYRKVTSPADCLLLQKDLDNIYSWTINWQLRLNESKCLAFLISNKKKLITFMYKINTTSISWNSIVKYLGVHIKSNLSWSHHCKIVSAKAKRTLNFLHHSLWGATTTAKSVAYKSLIRPLLEYACQVWSPHTAYDISTLENVQHRARWACGSWWNPASRRWNKSSDDCVDMLHWPKLTDCCNYLSVSTLYDIFNKRTSLNFSDYYHHNTSATRVHDLTIVPL